MTRVLYISYTGLLDPLGQSQVLQYLRELAAEHAITLLTFEKPENLSDRMQVAAMEEQTKAANIDWHRRVWHQKPTLPATAWDIVFGSREAIALARKSKAQIVHCRSYVGSLIGLQVKRATGAKLLFDMRGFWGDERVDAGYWNRSGFPYRMVKRIERTLFENADHVVSLTRNGVRTFEAFEYLKESKPPSSVIPTCTNLSLFKPPAARDGPFTLGYIGSVGSWYLFDQVARVVARLFELRPDARFLAVNKGGHDIIRSELSLAGVDMSRVEIVQSPYDQVGQYAARMHAGIFFIMPAWSKRASCPTRMGEFLGSGAPCLANNGVGDVEEDLSDTQTGIVLPTTSEGRVDLGDLDHAINSLLSLAEESDVSDRCRDAAERLFSLEKGVAEYGRIYRNLSSEGPQV